MSIEAIFGEAPARRKLLYVEETYISTTEYKTRFWLTGCQQQKKRRLINIFCWVVIAVSIRSSPQTYVCFLPKNLEDRKNLPGITIHMLHDDAIKWKHFLRYWPFVREIHRSPVNSPHKGQKRGALMFSLICAWINGWVNNREAANLTRHCAHYGVIIMLMHWTSQPWQMAFLHKFSGGIVIELFYLKWYW